MFLELFSFSLEYVRLPASIEDVFTDELNTFWIGGDFEKSSRDVDSELRRLTFR